MHVFGVNVHTTFPTDPSTPLFDPVSLNVHQLIQMPLLTRVWFPPLQEFEGHWREECHLHPRLDGYSVQSSLTLCNDSMDYVQRVYQGNRCDKLHNSSLSDCPGLCPPNQGQVIFTAILHAKFGDFTQIDGWFYVDLLVKSLTVSGTLPPICTGVWLDDHTSLDVTNSVCGDWNGTVSRDSTVTLRRTGNNKSLFSIHSQLFSASNLTRHRDFDGDHEHCWSKFSLHKTLIWVDVGPSYTPITPSEFGSCATFIPPPGTTDLYYFMLDAPIAETPVDALVNPTIGDHTDFKAFGLYSPLPIDGIASWVSQVVPQNGLTYIQMSIDATLAKLQTCSRVGAGGPLVTITSSKDGSRTYSFCLTVNFLFATLWDRDDLARYDSITECYVLEFDSNGEPKPPHHHNYTDGSSNSNDNSTLIAAFFAQPSDYWSQRLSGPISLPSGSDVTIGVREKSRHDLSTVSIQIYNLAICRIASDAFPAIEAWLALPENSHLLCADIPAGMGVFTSHYFWRAARDPADCKNGTVSDVSCIAQAPKLANIPTDFTCHPPNHLHMCRKEPVFGFRSSTEYNSNQYIGCDGISLEGDVIIDTLGELSDSSQTYFFNAYVIDPVSIGGVFLIDAQMRDTSSTGMEIQNHGHGRPGRGHKDDRGRDNGSIGWIFVVVVFWLLIICLLGWCWFGGTRNRRTETSTAASIKKTPTFNYKMNRTGNSTQDQGLHPETATFIHRSRRQE